MLNFCNNLFKSTIIKKLKFHRNRNINHLWQRALGQHYNERREENDRPEDNIWQHLLDRFQTNLDDWSGAEEEGV